MILSTSHDRTGGLKSIRMVLDDIITIELNTETDTLRFELPGLQAYELSPAELRYAIEQYLY